MIIRHVRLHWIDPFSSTFGLLQWRKVADVTFYCAQSIYWKEYHVSFRASTAQFHWCIVRYCKNVRYFLLANSTDFYQALDYFIILTLIEVRRCEWEGKKIEMTEKPNWLDRNQVFWRLLNMGMHSYIKHPVKCLNKVNFLADKNKVPLVRCACWIKCTKWETTQLFQNLWCTIQHDRDEFSRTLPTHAE